MTQRGRGCLEINPSSNPFFQTTANDIGKNPQAITTWSNNVQLQSSQELTPKNVSIQKEDFSFLYARTSDVIGSKAVQKPSAMSQAMTTTPNFSRGNAIAPPLVNTVKVKADAEAVLRAYHHQPKDENPLYTTSSSEYGKKAPTLATFVADRESRPQGFSKSFQGIKPKNSSLNTGLTKSTVHPKLDPQFV